jgi:phage-related baseplate assembly protein
MAYSKINNTPKKEIKYLNKNYNQLKQNLIEFSRNYFPDQFNDFSESNPGMIFLELAAYVGDVLSFYTDTQIQETFIETAQEKTNLLALAYTLGYKPSITSPSTTNLDLFIEIPAKGTSPYDPDFNYAITIDKNSSFLTTAGGNGTSFLLEEDVNFQTSSSLSPTTITIHQLNGSNPEYYLLKKTAKAISAELKSKSFEIGNAQRFLTLELNDSNIIGIESITDSDGNNWTEVPYLAQETVYEQVANVAANNPDLNQYNGETPYLLRLKKVPKRFVTRYTSNNILQIQFGAGISSGADEEIIPNPDNIGLGVRDGRSLLDFAYDPSNFLYTKAYGEPPSNTTLTVTYLVGGGVSSNVDSGIVTRKGTITTRANTGNLVTSTLEDVIDSIAVNNPIPATGGGPGDSLENIRLNAAANAASQLRTVSKEDYIIRTLSMPQSLGSISKAYIIKDDQITADSSARIENPNGLNLFILGYNKNKQLTNINAATRQNLITYLEQYRMLTDSINLKDAAIINFNIDFEIVTYKDFSNDKVILDCIQALKDYFNIDNWQINQPIIINEVYNVIGKVPGVQNVENVILANKAGISLGYSQYAYDFDSATVNNIIYPSLDTSIFEIKYPNSDIKGRVTKY